MHPVALVETCCAQMGGQLQALGLSHDDRRIAAYHEPAFYRWVQWVFLRLLEAGHCTRRQAMVLWCPRCDASLTEGLAEAGRCWRCHSPVEQRLRLQWFVREADFAEAMLEGLNRLDGWPESTRSIHRDWIGRRVGWRVEVAAEGRRTRWRCSSSARATWPPPWPSPCRWIIRWSPMAMLAAPLPAAGPIPLAGVDERLLASPAFGAALVPGRNPAHDRLLSELGLTMAAPAGGCEPAATPAVAYRLKDWCVTRQRYWGPPVPVIHCDACGPQPVPEQDLPVLLPTDVDLAAPGNPLVSHAAFKACVCPRCGMAAARDTDTFEAYSSPWWYLWLPMEPGEADLFDAARAARWLPVDLMIGGADQVRSCFFHVRMIAKALKALGLSDVDEPVAELLPIGMVQTAGVKMSKSAGNTVRWTTSWRPTGATPCGSRS